MNNTDNIVSESKMNKEWLESLINSMSDSVIAVDSTYNIIHYNAASLSLLDTNISIINQPIDQVVILIDKNNKVVEMKSLLKQINNSFFDDELFMEYKSDKSRINVSLSISPVHLGFGRDHSGYVLVIKDITREKSIDEERDEFISVVSHELRNPIAVAEGNLSNIKYALEHKKDITNFNRAIDQSYEQIIFLSNLINDLTSLNRAEKNKIPDTIDQINPKNLVDDLIIESKAKIEEKGLQIIAKNDPNLEVFNSSLVYVKEILQNFITNAIKYSDSGTIIISCHKMKDHIKFSVTDNGIGISKADQGKVFDKFFRAEDYRTSKTTGTGLGLYISQKLAKILCSEITFESVINHGSTFNLILPMKLDDKHK